MATLTFCGAAQQVTGSCYLVETAKAHVLLDCGLFQGPPEVEAQNQKPFPFDPTDIAAVVLSHAHLDHSGLLPKLVRDGFRGPIYATAPTRDLLDIMLKDAAYLQERDAQWEAQRNNRPVEEAAPLYTITDAEAAIARCRSMRYDESFAVAPGIEARFHNAGHILGSASIALRITEGHRVHRLVFSGDLGNGSSPLLPAPTAPPTADTLLLESTYGDRNHRSMAATLQEFEEILAAAGRAGGNVLIPAFAVERTQEILYRLGEFFQAERLPQRMVFLDSPMAIAATEVYLQHQRALPEATRRAIDRAGGSPASFLPTLRLTRTPEESMTINRIRGAIIIAGSGMCTGGRIRHHLRHNLDREDTHIVFVGFQARGTPGRALVDGAKTLRLLGRDYAVRAQIHTLGGFSAHAGQSELIDWARTVGTQPRCFLVHGEPEKIEALAGQLQQRLGWRTRQPAPGERITLGT